MSDMETAFPRNVVERNRDNDCRNCKRKSIRCSQTHPACQECLQKGHHCRFLISRGGPMAWRSAYPTTMTITTQATPVIQGAAPMSELTRMTATPVPRTLNLVAFRASVQGSWLMDHYNHRPALQRLLVVSSSDGFGAAAASATTAISATLFGRFHNLDSKPVKTPYCIEYASAVQKLALQVPLFQRECLEEVVVPAMLLLITDSWMTGQSREHYAGLEQLVKISGDFLFRGPHFDTFREVRHAMVWYAMCRSERTIFAEEWWKTVPFALATSPKTSSDYLVDHMADIATLFADAKNMTEELPSMEAEYRARAILHQLFSWRWSWLARHHDNVFEVSASESKVFDTILRYTQPHLMYEIWLCNALVILLLAFLKPQENCSAPTCRVQGLLWQPSDSLTVQEAALEICRSFQYQLENLSVPAPAHQWAMPLALAYVTLDPVDPIAVAVKKMIYTAPENRQWSWLCYIKRLQNNDPNAYGQMFPRWLVCRLYLSSSQGATTSTPH